MTDFDDKLKRYGNFVVKLVIRTTANTEEFF
jgi:hypothetical protein